jgi:hypothetical protein
MSPLSLRSHERLASSAEWNRLAAIVRDFAPDVVVLVARKMPRVAECFELRFGEQAKVITDLGIPFSHELIRAARVAIIDDVVNVGSTLHHARECVSACGAAQSALFAFGTRGATSRITPEVRYLRQTPLSDAEYRNLVTEVALTIRGLPKPYDVEFPIIPCVLRPPLRTSRHVLSWLREHRGIRTTHDLSVDSSVGRITLDHFGQEAGNFKLRFYIDERTAKCNIVPFAIPSRSTIPELRHATSKRLKIALANALAETPPGSSLNAEGPVFRANLFLQSLDWGLTAIADLAEIFGLAAAEQFSIPDACLLFGTAINADATVTPAATMLSTLGTPAKENESGERLSPFVERIATSCFLADVRECATSGEEHSLFAAIFQVLAERVGASDPSSYSIEWPYSRSEVEKSPYLRLRIGPTFDDVVHLIRELTQSASVERLPLENFVSALLDFAIDSGAVVPTVARYDGRCYRVYRQGEIDFRDRVADRVVYALHHHKKPMALTRIAKINAILAYSAGVEPVMWPVTLVRGNAASLQETYIDEQGPEMAQYLRDIGRLRPYEGKKRD